MSSTVCLSPCVPYKLANTSSTCSCQPFQALKAEQKPGVVHFSAVKHPGACRLARAENTWCQSKEYGWNKCVCNCRWKKLNTKQLAGTMHADYCHMLLIYEQCLLWQRCLIFSVFELLVSWSRSWLTYSIKKPFKIWKLKAVICYSVILNDYKMSSGGPE